MLLPVLRSIAFILGIFLLTLAACMAIPALLLLLEHRPGELGAFSYSAALTVLSGLDLDSPALLLWRSMLQWLGGLGFIGMAVVILPLLRVGGMRLFRTESSDWSDKVLPRSHMVAKSILALYLGLTLLCVLAYRWAGMSAFEAINHGMTTISTGGYSTSDCSLAHWQQPAVHWLAVHSGMPWLDALRVVSVNVVSVVTTTGFALDDYLQWGDFAIMLFFYLTFVGGCSGSTADGLKIFRFQVAWVLLMSSLRQLVHPRAVISQHYNRHRLDDDIVRSILSFSFFFTITIGLLALALALCGLDWVTALSGAATAVCNVGPGLGEVIGPSGNFASLPDTAKWLLAAGMLLGRLEIITVLVLFTPAFWRH